MTAIPSPKAPPEAGAIEVERAEGRAGGSEGEERSANIVPVTWKGALRRVNCPARPSLRFQNQNLETMLRQRDRCHEAVRPRANYQGIPHRAPVKKPTARFNRLAETRGSFHVRCNLLVLLVATGHDSGGIALIKRCVLGQILVEPAGECTVVWS